MKRLKIEFPENSLEELDRLLKETKEKRVFRRAQAVKQVVEGKSMRKVSRELNFTYSVLFTWVHRFALYGIEGLYDKARTGRPKKVTPEIEDLVEALACEDPLEHNSVYSQWTCSELLRVLETITGVRLSRETLRKILKKKGIAIINPERT